MSGRKRWIVSLLAAGLLPAAAAMADAPTSRPALAPTSRSSIATATATTALPAIGGYRTVETAISFKPQPTTRVAAGRVGYLGVEAARDADGRLVVDSVDPASPAATAGLRAGDVLLRAGAEAIARPDSFQEWLLGRAPGDSVAVTVSRDGKEVTVSATLAAVSRPMKAPGQRAVMGVQLRDVPQGDGVIADSVQQGSPAQQGGMRDSDVIVELDGVAITNRQALSDALAARSPGDDVKVGVKRAGKLDELHIKLAAEKVSTSLLNAIERFPGPFRKDTYRLALIGVEYPDIKHNPKINAKDWEQSFFSKGTYTETSATSQPVFGSVNDFYVEASAGAFHLEGKMFDWVTADKKRAEYGYGTGDNAKLLPEVLDKLLAREGKDALAGYDGIAFVYAGERVATTRGGLYWPHKGYVPHAGKRWAYLIVNEGGAKMTNISVFTHEFGHMLGLPDLYARPENPGSEGLGVWCLMSNQIATGRPQHMSAWCKEQLGWIKPTIIDPTVKQRLVLSPIEGSSRECFKVLMKADGSEYLLLENRRKTGFDTELPGEGLLIWRVVGGKPVLEASHGIDGPAKPRSFLRDVPFPSSSNHAFTPYTVPSSRSLLGGGLPVFITEIERRDDGRVTFAVGYRYF